MAILKSRISSPLEAAPPTQTLPPHLTEAFEYISSRLIRKDVNLSLILVGDDTPLPAAPSPPLEEVQSPSSATSTSFFSRAFSPVLPPSPSWPLSPMMPSSPLSPRSPRSLFSPRLFTQASSSPLSPRFPLIHSMPSTPRTPRTPASPLTLSITPTSITPLHPLITLLHATEPTPKAQQTLITTLHKASLRFPLRFATPPAQPTLIHRSLHQHHVMFSAEGLTLLSLDRVYTLKLALSTYSRLLSTGAPAPPKAAALSKAVKELRALVFAQGGRPLANAYLQRAYDHLPVSPFALRAVNAAFMTQYGGETNPISGVQEEVPRLVVMPPVRRERERESVDTMKSFRGPYCRGPETPGGWDDITPGTRGEWGFVVGGWKGRGGVETC